MAKYSTLTYRRYKTYKKVDLNMKEEETYQIIKNLVDNGVSPMVMVGLAIALEGDNDSPYCCILYDHNKREIVDIIKSRQLPYLNEYFNAIPGSERNNVKYFVSDMYDGYKNVCKITLNMSYMLLIYFM